jgi:uncharacterized protein with FMN-binding domain
MVSRLNVEEAMGLRLTDLLVCDPIGVNALKEKSGVDAGLVGERDGAAEGTSAAFHEICGLGVELKERLTGVDVVTFADEDPHRRRRR